MCINGIKLLAKNEKELETLTHAPRICSPDLGMEFNIEKCATLVMKSSKQHLTDRMELPKKSFEYILAQNNGPIKLNENR